MIGNKNVKHGLTRAQRASLSGELARARRKATHLAEGGPSVPNARTHIGRPVLNSAGEPIWERVPSIHGHGRYRIKVEYVPIFADPESTAHVMVRAAARKAALDARREAKADRIAITESRRAVKRLTATYDRQRRTVAAMAREVRAMATGDKSWTLPKRLQKRVAS